MASVPVAASRHVSHIVPETEPVILVDTFKKVPRGSFVFFLSHFHADHYSGLSSSWSRGTVYCSVVTARLITTILRVNGALVRGLDLNTEYEIADARVTLLDANHCPGAVMFLCKTKGGKTYLHTGDFRYDRHMVDHPALANCHIDTLFLDTTYAKPEYEFQPQADTIQHAINVAEELCKQNGQPGRVLFLVGSYTIGKEKIALALSQAFGWKVFASGKRRRILDCLQLEQLRDGRLSDDPADSCIHIVPMNTIGTVLPYFRPNFSRITKYVEDAGLSDVFTSVAGFLPTGWSFTSKWNKEHSTMSSGCISVHLLEYSEHSSYTELKEFVGILRPRQVIPTVYSNQKDFSRLLRDMQRTTTADAASSGSHTTQGNSARKRARRGETPNQKQLKITSFFSSATSVSATENVSLRNSLTLMHRIQNSCQRSHPEVIELSD
uniref:DNA repair metallo-beta-lactamase n=1 Tax=Neospora caninum (strain Liverpool) TaxID=572307 RepID=A0A0F7UIM3_NEOCL|nr:TPA: DNA repair metallo-beta-lactamase [Neospora caninum Liverpool]